MSNHWMAFGMDGVGQAAALFGLTFLSEDAAVLTAAVMAGADVLSWPVAFAACFSGIWLGDLWLYGMARTFGAPFVGRFKVVPAVIRSEAWFNQRGALVLVVSRFVPGLRLPSYLAAGVIRFPIKKFTVVTGLAAAVWVAVIFAVGHFLGIGKIPLLRDHAIWLAAGALLSASIVIAFKARIGGRVAERVRTQQSRIAALLARLSRWEFWPSWLFYAPVGLFYGWLALRYRSLTLPTAANPGIPMGGLVGESKFDTLRILQANSPAETAQTWLLAPGPVAQRLAGLELLVARHLIPWPLILKPDVGQRGAGVKLIRSLEAARKYLSGVHAPVLLQRYAPGPREAGIFYYRLPNERCGRIFAITEKLFPCIHGDGHSTVEALICADSRAAVIAPTYLRRFKDQLARVLAPGESLKLVEAGNHAQGCVFQDGMHLATPELLAAMDRISNSIPGFFIGRYDVRYAEDADLRAGCGLTILELNGAGAEATSIYDRHNSLFGAYRTLYRQWELVFRIGAANRSRGNLPASLRQVFAEWRRTAALIATYPGAD